MASGSGDVTAGAGAAGAGGAGRVTVRPARRDDMPQLHAMIHDLAAFEGYPDGPKLSVQDLQEDGFGSTCPWFFALVAEREGQQQMVGYALCNRAYSSWTRRAFYVEDLYVRPEARRAGVGRALLRHLAQMAVRERAGRIDWHVLESNAPALAFYSGLGARDMRLSEGRAALRLDAQHIHALADTA